MCGYVEFMNCFQKCFHVFDGLTHQVGSCEIGVCVDPNHMCVVFFSPLE